MKRGLVGILASAAALATAGYLLTNPVIAQAKARVTTVNGTDWRNSLDDALIEAKRLKRPVLFFSMFGRIDEKLPCANARTLRATLFQDPEFKKFVTEEVVPAWEMVRPVPHVTIDFGDGKKVERTVRGNAVMYLVTPAGNVLDAFPGVYTAKDFLPAARASIKALGEGNVTTISGWHAARASENTTRPGPTTGGKSVVESPTLFAIGASPISGPVTSVRPGDSAERVQFLVAASGLSDLSLTPMPVQSAVNTVLAENADKRNPNLPARIIEADSFRNMTAVRRVVHLWLASEKRAVTPAQARDVVLETILKIPYKDPYFGLEDVLLPGTPAAKP